MQAVLRNMQEGKGARIKKYLVNLALTPMSFSSSEMLALVWRI